MMDSAPWSGYCASTECTLHQLAPYIGKIKSNIVKELVKKYTQYNDTIFDPFAGSGTVPLESLLLGRNAIANDINPYAVTLIKAKMFPPDTLKDAVDKANYYTILALSQKDKCSLCDVPDWVKNFFHPTTLKEIIQLVDILKQNEEYFLLACLLGILHHQRPGFLSYPSSHLVPYLKIRKYPKEIYKDLYCYREVAPRLIHKIERSYKRFPSFNKSLSRICFQQDSRTITLPENSIDAVITSPPYMNTLDYGRDNRLRLWFLGVEDYAYFDEMNPSSIYDFKTLMSKTIKNINSSLKVNSYLIFILGDVRNKKSLINTSSIVKDNILNQEEKFKLVSTIMDEIPDIRRTRRNGSKTKNEWIMVFQKEN